LIVKTTTTRQCKCRRDSTATTAEAREPLPNSIAERREIDGISTICTRRKPYRDERAEDDVMMIAERKREEDMNNERYACGRTDDVGGGCGRRAEYVEQGAEM